MTDIFRMKDLYLAIGFVNERRAGRRLVWVGLGSILAMLCGCASETVTHSGFLSDYGQLATGPGHCQ
jgi:hypothetical protein